MKSVSNMAILFSTNVTEANALGNLWKSDKNDSIGAQADFKKAIEMNPKLRESIEANGYLTNGTNSN